MLEFLTRLRVLELQHLIYSKLRFGSALKKCMGLLLKKNHLLRCRVWHAGLLHKLKYYEISCQIFGLISSFLINRQLRVVLDEKSSYKYPVNTGVPQGSILGPTLFLLYTDDLPDDVICNIAIYTDDTTLYSK